MKNPATGGHLIRLRDRRAPVVELRPVLRPRWRDGFVSGLVTGFLLACAMAWVLR